MFCRNATHDIPWDPRATLQPINNTKAGKSKVSPSTAGPKLFPKARVAQIVTLTLVGLVGAAVCVGKNCTIMFIYVFGKFVLKWSCFIFL